MIIEKLDGTRYNLRDLDIRTIDFVIGAPEVLNQVIELDGGGYVISDSKHGLRPLTCIFRFVGIDMSDYFILMREIFALFNGLDYFYLINPYEPGMRWKVKTDGSYTPSRKLFSGNFTINFVCPSGIAESIGTSLDLQNRKEWDADLWQWGMGIDYDEDYRYEHTTNVFVVKNIGNVVIDPREHELEMVLRGTFASSVTVRNKTTGDEFVYNGALTSSDTLKLTGVRTLKNDVSVLKDTNKKLITLNTGANEFEIIGGTITSIAFNFRFLYM